MGSGGGKTRHPGKCGSRHGESCRICVWLFMCPWAPSKEARAIARAGTAGSAAEAAETSRPSTYGEVTPLGVRQIGRALGLDKLAGEPAVFMDLGSGVGKLVAQAYLEWPAVVRAVGVELSHTRAASARAAWGDLSASGDAAELRAAAAALGSGPRPPAPGEIVFLEGDLFEVDVSEATHIYLASLCFSDGMLSRVAGKLSAEAARLRAVASLRRFPGGLPGFEGNGSVEARMSWSQPRTPLATTAPFVPTPSAGKSGA
ncbi:unnamed protein product, partial [Prorocentrum cordatum]